MTTGGSGRRSVIGGMMVLAAIMIAVVIALFAITLASTDQKEIGLHYTGGPIEGQHFVGIIQPGQPLRPVGLADSVYKLPNNQRTYTISKSAAASDSGKSSAITALNSDGVEFTYQTTMNFQVNTTPDVANEFFLSICTKYDDCEGYDEKIAPGEALSGWNLMLQDYLLRAEETTLQTVSRELSTDFLSQSDEAISKINSEVNGQLPRILNDYMGGPYLENITFTVNAIDPPSTIKDKYDDLKASQIDTQVAAQQVKQAQQQNLAAQKISTTLQNNPNYVEYLKAKAMQDAASKGQVELWVVPEGQSMNLPAP